MRQVHQPRACSRDRFVGRDSVSGASQVIVHTHNRGSQHKLTSNVPITTPINIASAKVSMIPPPKMKIDNTARKVVTEVRTVRDKQSLTLMLMLSTSVSPRPSQALIRS